MERLGVTDIYDTRGNILLCADYLVELIEKHEDLSIALGFYNGNSNTLELAKSGKMTGYAKKVLKRSEELERAHGK